MYKFGDAGWLNRTLLLDKIIVVCYNSVMNKIIPIILLALSIFACVISLIAIVLVFSAFSVPALAFAAAMVLVIGCVITVFPLAGGIIFKGKICKTALAVSVISAIIIAVGFIVLYSV